MANSVSSFSIDPEQEAFRALKATICTICQKQDITLASDVRLQKIVDRYKERYPSLTPQLIEDEIKKMDSGSSPRGMALSLKSGSRRTQSSSSMPRNVDLERKPSVAASSLGDSRRSRSSNAEAGDAPSHEMGRSASARSGTLAATGALAGLSSGGSSRSSTPKNVDATSNGGSRSSTPRNLLEATLASSRASTPNNLDSAYEDKDEDKDEDIDAAFDEIASRPSREFDTEADDAPSVASSGKSPMDLESKASVEVSPLKKGPTGAEIDEHLDDSGPMMVMYDMPCCTEDEERMNHKIIYPKRQQPVEEGSGCCFEFKKRCRQNGGYNLLTYTLLLTFFVVLMFLTSVISTYVNYNHGPYRDWALAGAVTSTSVQFRVRGPDSDDGKRREFVVSRNPNLALERDQIMNVAVSYGDYEPEEYFVKRLSMDNLSPSTTYYYGITRPQRTPNSAVVAGDVGRFTTPAPEGTRMDFTIATGSCALTGSKSDMFTEVLDTDPLMFIHMGDFHYEDLNTLEVDRRLEAYDRVMGSPTQRLLYMSTIFSYIWDDHDWLGNNQDSEDEQAALVAKQAYTVGIPHYPLGQTNKEEADAAKYQAFTIGTVRFIITDLRSESVKSSEYFSGKVYSQEQRNWLFDEFSRAANYDFVVWVTTRPWTDPDELGSDSWGGFVQDRDELSAFIASTIGAGPRNLLVISGDNHMVAYDDGSSTDYSKQDYYPGGFPLLHSGPLSNYGSGLVDFFKPQTNYFTNGCMAVNSEVNYQFSTVDFYFPSDDDRTDREEAACLRIRSYSKDANNVIFEKELCGETMKFGTPEQDTCQLKKFTIPTMSLFIAAAGLLILNGILALYFLGIRRCSLALSYLGLGILYYLLTVGAAVAGAFSFGTLGVNMFAVSIFVLVQVCFGFLFVSMALVEYHFSPDTTCANNKKSTKERVSVTKPRSSNGDEEAGINAIHKSGNEAEMKVAEDEGDATTYDDTVDGMISPTSAGGRATAIKEDDCGTIMASQMGEEVSASGWFKSRGGASVANKSAAKGDNDGGTAMASQMGEELSASDMLRRAIPHSPIPEEEPRDKEYASLASRFLSKTPTPSKSSSKESFMSSAAPSERREQVVRSGSSRSSRDPSAPSPNTVVSSKSKGSTHASSPAGELALIVVNSSKESTHNENPVNKSKKSTHSENPVIQKMREAAMVRKSDDDHSEAAVVGGKNSNSSSFEEKVASVLPSSVKETVAAALAKTKKSVEESASAALALANDSFLSYTSSGEGKEGDAQPKEEEPKDEGIEVTNPTSKGYNIKVSPSLISM